MNLTEVKFWESYWASCPLPSLVNRDFSFDRCLADYLDKHCYLRAGNVFEVGCAPGKWLSFFYQKWGMTPCGIEYTTAGMKATTENFSLLNIRRHRILSGDFFSHAPEPIYDTVMSYGFVEHFDDPDAVIQRHIEWLKPGGTLIIGVPNFRGIYYYLQAILDQTILDKHNLSIMTPSYFEYIARRLRLEKKDISYIGSFEPSLLIAPTRCKNVSAFIVKCIVRALLYVRKPTFWDRLNHPSISSYLVAIYTKPLST